MKMSDKDRRYLIEYTITRRKNLKKLYKEKRITGNELKIAYNELEKMADIINMVFVLPEE
jgi:hypothetical protein